VQLTGPPRWLWRGKVPEGAVSLLAGRPKLGKSLLTVWLAAQLSRGLLEGDYREQPARTLLIAAEDPPDLIVKPRLIAAAADESLVGTLVQDRQDRQDRPREEVGGLGGLDGAGTYARRITIPDEYELLEQIVVENEVALVVLDPINSFITHKVDAHRDAEIRRVLDPLAALAARRRFSSLAVVHLNRRSDTDILNRITGSAGYGGSARSILTFGRHPENPVQRVVAAEGNWQKESQSDLFEIREVVVFPDVDPDDQTQPALVHIGVSELESSDLIDQFDDERTAIEEAKDYLYGELVGGPVPVADLRRGAEANGLSWRTVERAKKLLGVDARRVSSASSPRGAGRWEWFLELIEDDQQQEGATP
jgi:AAA domain